MKKVYLIYLAQLGADYHVMSRQNYGFVRKPQLGLLYLAASLLNKSLEVDIFDQSVEDFSFELMVSRIATEKPFFVGIYSDSILKPRILALVKLIKKNNSSINVVVGGPASMEYRDFLNNGVDIVCHGEGEATICEIADYLLAKKEIGGIKGISYVKNGEIVSNEERELIEDLDSIPFPAREKVNINKYYDYHIFGMEQPYVTMIASRGCPNRCSFCSSSGHWGYKYRLRSAKNVVDEIEMLISKYGIRYIGFKDDIFGGNLLWVNQFIDEMKRRRIKIKFSCMLHPFSFKGTRRETLLRLKEVGLDMIIPGLQSVNERVLKNINRHPEEPKYLEELIREAKKISITTVIEFILGLPGDNEGVFKDNLRFALKVKPHYALFYSLTILPGSEIERVYKDRKITAFSEEEIKKWTRKCQRSFFLNPAIIFQDIMHILHKNPIWFLKAFQNLSYISQCMSLVKGEQRFKDANNL